jgi:hypothetical protein
MCKWYFSCEITRVVVMSRLAVNSTLRPPEPLRSRRSPSFQPRLSNQTHGKIRSGRSPGGDVHRRAVRFGARTTGVRWRALRRQRVPFGQYRARYLARWIWFVKFRLRQGSICVWCWCVWTMTSMSGDVGDARDPTCSDT